jgi:hypothetical protein
MAQIGAPAYLRGMVLSGEPGEGLRKLALLAPPIGVLIALAMVGLRKLTKRASRNA